MYQDNPYLEDPQQLQHFRQNLAALINYSEDSYQLYAPVQASEVNSNIFIVTRLNKRAQILSNLVNLNQQFLSKLLPKPDNDPLASTSTNISKVRSTLRQFYRQWCQQSEERLNYIEILNLFKKFKTAGKVLIPGCGLGRIVLEFVRAGYSTEGNEVSYLMLFGSQFMLNEVEQKNSIQIAPFVHNMNGYKNKQDPLRVIKIPDVVAAQQVNESSEFSMRAGEFVDVYGKDHQTWDGIVTCFFLDTATNVFQYVNTIYNILVQDGLWVNYGPLLYHFRDNLSQQSVEVSWETLRRYIIKFFDIKQQSIVQTTYCHDSKSSSKLIYRCIKFAASKKKQDTST